MRDSGVATLVSDIFDVLGRLKKFVGWGVPASGLGEN